MSAEKITAEKRTEFGKGAARRIRRERQGPRRHLRPRQRAGPRDPARSRDDDGPQARWRERAARARRRRRHPAGADQAGPDRPDQAPPRAHRLRRRPQGREGPVDIVIHLVGEAATETLVVTENTTISVEAEATHIPESIEVDIEGAEVGTQIHASDLTLPKGTTLLTDAETLIVNITNAPTAEEVEAELEEAEAEAGIEREESTEEAAAEGEAAEGEAPAEGGEEG